VELIRGLHNLNLHCQDSAGCVATIGNFDGVHLGHQAILRQVQQKAVELGAISVAMVFEPQPREFFAAEHAPPRLMRFREKFNAIKHAGVERLLCLQFNSALRKLSADAFVKEVLVDGLALKHLVVGDDFRYGCDRSGDFDHLQVAGARYGFTVENTCTVESGGERVSSTRVRDMLEQGDLTQAAALLGRPYTLSGRVTMGNQIGRTIDVPTANLPLYRDKTALNGVFSVQARINSETFNGVANIGKRPSVDGLICPILEVHLFDFNRDIYGERMEVQFQKKLREEKKFNSLDELKENIHNDIQQAKEYFQNQPN